MRIFKKLNSHDKIYSESSLKWTVELDDDLNIENIIPIGFFPGQIINKLRDTLKEKEIKFKNYKKFNENNLYIQTLSADDEEYREFEKNTDFSNCCFDYIYISNFWSKENPIYIIDTKK